MNLSIFAVLFHKNPLVFSLVSKPKYNLNKFSRTWLKHFKNRLTQFSFIIYIVIILFFFFFLEVVSPNIVRINCTNGMDKVQMSRKFQKMMRRVQYFEIINVSSIRHAENGSLGTVILNLIRNIEELHLPHQRPPPSNLHPRKNNNVSLGSARDNRQSPNWSRTN